MQAGFRKRLYEKGNAERKENETVFGSSGEDDGEKKNSGKQKNMRRIPGIAYGGSSAGFSDAYADSFFIDSGHGAVL